MSEKLYTGTTGGSNRQAEKTHTRQAEKTHTRIQRLRNLYGDNCYWCGLVMRFRPPDVKRHPFPIEATIEHIVAKRDGGTSHPSNLTLAHETCNSARMDSKESADDRRDRMAYRIAQWLWMEATVPGRRLPRPLRNVYVVDMSRSAARTDVA